ncbi:MAG: hypothetical protein ABSD20_05375, partial [Terriglobales bacterium]
MLVDFVNRADVGMVERRGCTGLALESFQRQRVLESAFGQELEGDLAFQVDILGLIDDTHAAAQLLQNPVVGNQSTDHAGPAPSGPITAYFSK